MITYDAGMQRFHLQTRNMSYVMEMSDGYLLHLYWGGKIKVFRGSSPLLFVKRGFLPQSGGKYPNFSLSTAPLEYPAYGNGDFRHPAYQIQLENGSTVTDLRYAGHRIYKGKPGLAGLPSTYTETDHEADTIDITLKDELTGLIVTLRYTLFRHFNALARSVQFYNGGKQSLKLLRVLSGSVDFRDDRFDILSFYGSHTNERNISRHPLTMEGLSIESSRGASSPQHDPFFALLRKGTDEERGEAFGFSFVYSGNFSAQIEVDQYRTTRASIGINPFDFSWLLAPGDSFQTPEVVMVYSDQGLGGMSRTYHRLYRTRLCRGTFRDRERPVLINNWEATYFRLNEKKIEALAKEGKKLGIELFVVDDGWFGRRDNAKSSLGDWVVDRRKLPHGLQALSRRIHDLGMKFGLWFEPEMVSPDSDLYRRHPDWCLHVPDRPRTLSRHQLVLDLSRQDVRDYVIRSVSSVLAGTQIDYVKWDMNRHMTEIGSAALPPDRQRETAHRYMLGLYSILEQLTSAFPDVLFESCSSGGGRFDPGMLYYMPQTWASDNTDSVSRLKIQFGTSIVYPPIAIGAHVSAVPNHQIGRVTSLDMRGHVAMSGNFGYELDLTKLSGKEKQIIQKQVLFYKQIRPLVQFGDFYRIVSPFSGNEAAWAFVSPDKAETVVFYFRVLAEPAQPVRVLTFKGLDPGSLYQNVATGDVFGGDELMHAGVTVPLTKGDFISHVWRFKRKTYEEK